MQIRLVTNWHKLDNMLTHFPKLFLRFLSNSVEKAAEYYVNMLGFHIDWSNDQGGIGGSSQGVPSSPMRRSADTTAMAGPSWPG